MSRRKNSISDLLILLPWWVSAFALPARIEKMEPAFSIPKLGIYSMIFLCLFARL